MSRPHELRTDMYNQKFDITYDKAPFIEFFKSDKNVICAIVFGSAIDGIVRAGSDLDIAVLFHHPPKGEKKLEYYSKICDLNTGIERIDFIILNDANEILAFEALKGEYFCKNDIEKTARFFSITCRLYESQIASYERQLKYRKEYYEIQRSHSKKACTT